MNRWLREKEINASQMHVSGFHLTGLQETNQKKFMVATGRHVVVIFVARM